jgi:hypothetical protein
VRCTKPGLAIETVRNSLALLSGIGFCDYDEESEFVFVRNMARFQIAESLKPRDKRVLWIYRELEKLRNCPLFDRFLEVYGEQYQITAYFTSPGNPSKALLSIETETGNIEKERETGEREGGGVERGNQTAARSSLSAIAYTLIWTPLKHNVSCWFEERWPRRWSKSDDMRKGR